MKTNLLVLLMTMICLCACGDDKEEKYSSYVGGYEGVWTSNPEAIESMGDYKIIISEYGCSMYHSDYNLPTVKCLLRFEDGLQWFESDLIVFTGDGYGVGFAAYYEAELTDTTLKLKFVRQGGNLPTELSELDFEDFERTYYRLH